MYTRLSKIQTGSFSTVYRAFDSGSQQDVALKIVEKPADPATAEKLARLVAREYDILKRLGKGHRNVCALLDFHERDTCYVFVMEFAARGDLYDIIRSWKTRSETRVQIDFAMLVAQLCSAIQYAHSKGIAHRDIKPENVLIDAEGQVKLADWGLSCTTRISHDVHIGTEKYLAPEGHTSPHDTFLADYWSLGITLLFVMFGACPFKSAHPSRKTRNPNFTHFVSNPHQFISEYYFEPLRAGRGTLKTSSKLRRDSASVEAPAEWLCLPQVGYPTLSREQLLILSATYVATNLLLVNPAARSMQTFFVRMTGLLLPNKVPSGFSKSGDLSQKLASSSGSDSSDDLYANFFYSGLVTNPNAVASLYGDHRDSISADGSSTSGGNMSGSISAGSTTSSIPNSEETRVEKSPSKDVPKGNLVSSTDLLSDELECQTVGA
ncbi:LADA_0C11100g1_1 [Lachancea dasiensis]|uniref:LADA_0C11100g1_1 n=1 Tax=Lachancea dasiensis TaxID=1072105 RepID=A0A1G4J1A3_9SACH|nr:LADA_0C11100g1_1 [Lachancea dasiensis]